MITTEPTEIEKVKAEVQDLMISMEIDIKKLVALYSVKIELLALEAIKVAKEASMKKLAGI